MTSAQSDDMFPVGDEDACIAYLVAGAGPKASSARAAVTTRCMHWLPPSLAMRTVRRERLSFLASRRDDLRKHQQTSSRLVQYVVCAVHTNKIEGFWSTLKREIVGTFHNVSKKYLHLYVAEFQFRYNNRFNDDIFGTAIEGA